jgi:hypothetical protein
MDPGFGRAAFSAYREEGTLEVAPGCAPLPFRGAVTREGVPVRLASEAQTSWNGVALGHLGQ